MDGELLLDVNTWCRTCMSNQNKIEPGTRSKHLRRNIFDNLPGCNEGPTIMDLLVSVKPEIEVHITDKLPKVICCDCMEQLQVTYDFLKMYKDSDEKLRKMLKVDYVTTTAASPDTGPFVVYKEENQHIVESPKIKIEVEETEENCYQNVQPHTSVQNNNEKFPRMLKVDYVTTAVSPDPGSFVMHQEGKQHIVESPKVKIEVEDTDENCYPNVTPYAGIQDNDVIVKSEIEMEEENDNTTFQVFSSQDSEYEAMLGHCKEEDNWESMETSDSTQSQPPPQYNSPEFSPKTRRKDIEKVCIKRNRNEIEAETLSSFEDFPIESKKNKYTAIVKTAMNSEKLQKLHDLDYRIIRAEHEKSSLGNQDRTKLARIVIRHILQYDINIELNRHDFLFLADIIRSVLPQESKDWYYLEAKTRQKPTGKLYDAYNNYRRRLSQSGLLKNCPHVRQSISSEANEDEIVETPAFNTERGLQQVLKDQPEWNEIDDPNEDGEAKVASIITIESLQHLEDLDYKIIIRDRAKSCLENLERNKLSKIFIRHVLEWDVNIELTRHDFLYLADIITKILPQEPKDLYYLASKFGQRPSGKLYDAYNSYKKRLSQLGLMKRRAYVRKSMGGDTNEVMSGDSEEERMQLIKKTTKWFKSFTENCFKLEGNDIICTTCDRKVSCQRKFQLIQHITTSNHLKYKAASSKASISMSNMKTNQ